MTPTMALALLAALCLFSSFTAPAVAQGNGAPEEERECDGGCAKTYKACAGKGPDLACCSSDDHCVRKNSFYSGCFPKTRPIRDDWDGTILTCADGGGCEDPTAVASSWSGYELSEISLAIETFHHEEVNPTCAAECDRREACVAYQENEDGGMFCSLYADDVIALENRDPGTWKPNFDSVVFFVKCYRPPELCPAETVKEVDGTNPQLYEFVNQDFALVFLDEEFALGDCATICRMHPDSAGAPCVGFALRDSTDVTKKICFPLFDEQGPAGLRKEVELDDETTVYSIADCLSSR